MRVDSEGDLPPMNESSNYEIMEAVPAGKESHEQAKTTQR